MSKKIFIALGLAAVFALTACVEQQEINPNYNPVKNEVNTQFYFYISSAAGELNPETKMSDEAVQMKNGVNGGNFRGIDNATLFAFTQSTNGKKLVEPREADAMRNLSEVMKSTAITTEKGGTRVININLPNGTNTLVFYAAAHKEPVSGLDQREMYGSLSYTANEDDGRDLDLATKLGSYSSSRLMPAAVRYYDYLESVLDTIYNGILRVGINGPESRWNDHEETGLITRGGVSYNLNGKRIYWADYLKSATSAANPVSPLDNKAPAQMEVVMGNAYESLSTIKGDGMRAGSGPAVARVLSDLLDIATSGAAATPLDPREVVAIVICEQMKADLEQFIEIDQTSITQERIWKENQTVMTTAAVTIPTGMSTDTLYNLLPFNSFPAVFHLPAGAAILGLDEEKSSGNIKQFKYIDNNSLKVGTPGTAGRFAYPPELVYYCNSDIRTSDNQAVSSSAAFPSSYSNWVSDDAWKTSALLGYQWKSASDQGGGVLTAQTRGVAMRNTIEYGVAMLKSKVYVAAPDEKLYDNNHGVNGGSNVDKTIILDSDHYLVWKGILIGSQPDEVGWNYLRRVQTVTPSEGGTPSTVLAGANTVVYDKVKYRLTEDKLRDTCGLPVPIRNQSSTDPNYTLLYDNVDPTAANDDMQQAVLVALEFENHLGDFWGKDNMVRDGGTFYLLAKLDLAALTYPSGQTAETYWNNFIFSDVNTHGNMLPPYSTAAATYGQTRKIPRVFIQDFMTEATFNLTSNSLKYAYVTVPDLLSAKVSLGMAVDLSWNANVTFNVNLGSTE